MRHTSAVLLTICALVLGAATAPAHAAPTSTKISGFAKASQSARPGAALTYTVKVTAKGRASARRVVVLQRRLGGRWVKVDHSRSNRHGRVVLRYRAPAKSGAAIKLRVRVTKKGRLRAATSAVRKVTARAPWRPDARSKQILALVNEARSSARKCGGRTYKAQRALTLDSRLAASARGHARDMARHDYFSHTSRDGSSVGDRVTRQKYRWRAVSENIAAGQRSPAEVMADWLSSPGHCANIMSGAYRHLGVGYATDSDSRYVTYWVQNFAAPR